MFCPNVETLDQGGNSQVKKSELQHSSLCQLMGDITVTTSIPFILNIYGKTSTVLTDYCSKHLEKNTFVLSHFNTVDEKCSLIISIDHGHSPSHTRRHINANMFDHPGKTKIHPSIFYTRLIRRSGRGGGLEPIPAVIAREAGYTLDRTPVKQKSQQWIVNECMKY